jgi:hypothetical protein
MQDFYFPDVTSQSTGDGTVMSTSAITTAIKWIHENKQNKTSKPTKLVEFCSSYNAGNLEGLFDMGSKSFSSGYHGIECECIGKKVFQSLTPGCQQLQALLHDQRQVHSAVGHGSSHYQ